MRHRKAAFLNSAPLLSEVTTPRLWQSIKSPDLITVPTSAQSRITTTASGLQHHNFKFNISKMNTALDSLPVNSKSLRASERVRYSRLQASTNRNPLLRRTTVRRHLSQTPHYGRHWTPIGAGGGPEARLARRNQMRRDCHPSEPWVPLPPTRRWPTGAAPRPSACRIPAWPVHTGNRDIIALIGPHVTKD